MNESFWDQAKTDWTLIISGCWSILTVTVEIEVTSTGLPLVRDRLSWVVPVPPACVTNHTSWYWDCQRVSRRKSQRAEIVSDIIYLLTQSPEYLNISETGLESSFFAMSFVFTFWPSVSLTTGGGLSELIQWNFSIFW